MKLLKCSKPKRYKKTNLFFDNMNSANQYINNLKNNFLLNKTKQLEHPSLSKKKRKDLFYLKSKKYVLTKIGSKFCLWESY